MEDVKQVPTMTGIGNAESRLSPLLDESDELIVVVVKSIATAKTVRQKS
jgi:hypothetical protein